ncbi:MAG: hypothetical protein V4735_02065 [Pseudomonadota bacterium]
MFLRSVTVLCAMLALTACDRTTARYSDDYATKLSRNELLILPTNAQAFTVDAAGTQTRKYEYEGHIEPILATELQKQLTEKGYRATILHKKDLMTDKGYTEYAAFKEAFTAAYEATYKAGALAKREDAKHSVIRLNGQAKALGQKLNAPLMVYIDYNETARTADGQALDFAAGVAMQMLLGSSGSTPPDQTRAIVALIDTENDKVLWMNPGASAGGGMVAGMIYTDEEQSLKHIQNSLSWALRELPKRDDLFKKE